MPGQAQSRRRGSYGIDAPYAAAAIGVLIAAELQTGDLRALPFEDNSFDVVVSSLAIHNIRGRAGREKAIDEAVRVLRPGGRLMIADIRATRHHQAQLAKIGMNDVMRRAVGMAVLAGRSLGSNPPRDRHEAGTADLRGPAALQLSESE